MSRYALLKARLNDKPVADIFFVIFTFLAGTLFLFMGTWIDTQPVLAMKGMYGAIIFTLGLVGTTFLVGMRWDENITPKKGNEFMSLVFISLMIIFLVNIMVPQLAITPITNTTFAILIGIAEEMFFRGFLLSGFRLIANNDFVAIVASSLIGTTFHAQVYGVNQSLMLIVFASFCVLGWIYLMSGQRLSVPMTAHILVNFISYMGSI